MSTSVRRRNRPITACLECRRRRRKCDRNDPCQNCVATGLNCVFLSRASTSQDSVNHRVSEYKRSLTKSEELLSSQFPEDERDPDEVSLGLRTGLSRPVSECRWLEVIGSEEFPPTRWEEGLRPWPMTTGVVSVRHMAAQSSQLSNMRVGRMFLASRIAGFYRPEVLEEVQNLAGNSSAYTSNPERVEDARSWNPQPRPGDLMNDVSNLLTKDKAQIQSSIVGFSLTRSQSDELIQHYLFAVHPIACVIQRSLLQRNYEAFWSYQSIETNMPPSLLALISSILFSAAASMSRARLESVASGYSATEFLNSMQQKTEEALIQAECLQTSDIETLQALVIYMICQFRGPVTVSHGTLFRSTLQITECMGLHREGSLYGCSEDETFNRRLLWFQLCVLDMRICESYGPRPAIRLEDFDVTLSLEDMDQMDPVDFATMLETENCSANSFNSMRFECNQMTRLVWSDMAKLEIGKSSLATVLRKIERFEGIMSLKYGHLLDDTVAFPTYTRSIMKLLIENIYVMVLLPYYTSSLSGVHEELRNLIVAHAIGALETVKEVENTAEYDVWSWNNISYCQYHSAYVLFVESMRHPMRPDIERIWAILNFVFDLDLSTPRASKPRIILDQLMIKIHEIHIQAGVRPRQPLATESQYKHSALAVPSMNDSIANKDSSTILSADTQSIHDHNWQAAMTNDNWLENMNIDLGDFPELFPSDGF
ncbi:hypothetical protein F5884DRAFT_776982 [Xylogone sp. PMI_703]|nr:hypothetical protein F5884DRAFT_776982 [Xylogone sp. PMI_703]